MSLFSFREDKKKNTIIQEYDIPQNIEDLNKWTIPRVKPNTIYHLGTFEKLGLKHVVKTMEESISLEQEEMILKLLNESDIIKYKAEHKFLHIGLVQIAFKPLTLKGLPESFIAALRDARNLNWKQSLMGIIQSSLAHGPVYFDVYPNLQLSLTDANITDALTLNVRTHGYNYNPGSEVICVYYRIYYKPLYTLNPQCKILDKNLNETILIETNFNKSKISTRRPIKWEEIEFPENWIIEKSAQPLSITQDQYLNIEQTPEGRIEIQFDNVSRQIGESSRRSYSSLDNSSIRTYYTGRKSTSSVRSVPIRSYISPLNNDHEAGPSRISTLIIPKDNIVKGLTRDEEITESDMNFSI